ncbi:MAG: transposase [Burkholderia sp.]
MSASRWVYWWADDIHTGVRREDSDGQCLLVVIGVKPDRTKERVAIVDGYREAKDSWLELLLDLKARGLKAGPLLASDDGAMGRPQGSLSANTASALLVLQDRKCTERLCPNRNTLREKAARSAIWHAATRAEALVAFDQLVATDSAKHLKTVEKLTKDRNELLAFYDFPAEHWQCGGSGLSKHRFGVKRVIPTGV